MTYVIIFWENQNKMSSYNWLVLRKIVGNVSEAKHFSVILDCTPDSSHQEQKTIILRFAEINSGSVDVVEHFVGFMTVDNSSGVGLTDVFHEYHNTEFDVK
jgi:hypothetical protein